MRSHDELDRALRSLEEWRREHQREHQHLRTEIREEVEDMNEAAARHVVDVLRPIQADVQAIKATNDTQLGLLREAAEERGRRKQREEDADRAARASAHALETRKVDLEGTKIDADLVKAQVDARVRRVIAIASLIGVIGAALVGAFAAAITSHSGGHAPEVTHSGGR